MAQIKGYIGIMVTELKQRKHVLTSYLRYNAGVTRLFCFTPSSINWISRTIIGLHRVGLIWKIRRFPFPQVVYNRCYNLDHNFIRRFEEVIGHNRFFNQINQFDKLIIYDILSNTEMKKYLPDSFSYNSERAEELFNTHNVVYYKPIKGSNGKGVYRVERKENGAILICHHHLSPGCILRVPSQLQQVMNENFKSKPYMIQRGIAVQKLFGKSFDIRVLVQKNYTGLWVTTNVVSRIAFDHYYNTSICEKICITEDVLQHLYPPEQVKTLMEH